MKNIIFTLILLISFSLPCLAANMLQQQAEKDLLSKPENIQKYKAMYSIFCIWQDYRLYKNDSDAITGYGYLLSLKEKYCKLTDTKSKINCKYINQLTTNMSKLGEYDLMDGQAETINKIQQEYKSSKIIIDDNDYKYLDPKILDIIIRTF